MLLSTILSPIASVGRRYNTVTFTKLLEAGEIQEANDMLDSVDINKALQVACKLGYSGIASQLLDRGANINRRRRLRHYGDTPLHDACAHLQLDIVELLVRRGAGVNIANVLGYNSLLIVCDNAEFTDVSIQIAKILIEHGADVEAGNTIGLKPLYMAASHNNQALVALLLERGALVDGSGEANPFKQACRNNCIPIIELLLKYHADINQRDDIDGCALSIAVAQSSYELVEVLLDHGADVMSLDAFHRPVIIQAIESSDIDMVFFLVQHGVYLPEESRAEVMCQACESGRDDIVALLLHLGVSSTVSSPSRKVSIIFESTFKSVLI